jgi:hypothetical protein
MLAAKLNALRAADPHSRKVFVVGCGRPATHWLGRAIEAHPSVRATFDPDEPPERARPVAADEAGLPASRQTESDR